MGIDRSALNAILMSCRHIKKQTKITNTWKTTNPYFT